jgi:hypothetical protein
MNETPIPGNIELLANGQYADLWMTEGPAGKWEMNEAGELVQSLAVGTRRGGTGTITVLKNPVSMAISGLRLTCRPGSQHQVGVVFNLVDNKNFCAFCIDRHNKKSGRYDLVAFSVTAGNYDVISKQSYTGELPETVTLVLIQVNADLALVFGEERAYTWKNMFLFGKRIGLYSYKNTDAAFLSLNRVPVLATPASTAQLALPETPAVITVSQEVQIPVNVIPENEVTAFLDIRPPASRTEIEFMEVFTIPLDSFYSSFFDSIRDGNMQSVSGGNSKVELLDLRVKRWYRELKAVRKNITAAMKDLIRKQDRIMKAEGELTAEQDDKAYKLLEDKLEERRQEEKEVAQRINDLHDTEGLLLREIRVNGYALVEDSSIDAIQKLGYDFHLVGQAVTRGEYDPVEFDVNLNFSDDGVWEDALKKLHQQLFDTGAIIEKGISLYEREREQLVDFQACPSLTENTKRLESVISSCEAVRPLHVKAFDDIEKDIKDWRADRETLLAQKERYIEAARKAGLSSFNYSPLSDWDLTYQLAVNGVGWLESLGMTTEFQNIYGPHPRFLSELSPPASNSGKRYRLKKFVADAYFLAVKPNLQNEIPGTVQTALAIHCPIGSDVLVSFYHRAQVDYNINPDVYEDERTEIRNPTYNTYDGWNWVGNYWDPYFYPIVGRRLVTGKSISKSEVNTFNSSQNLVSFFDFAVQVCDYFLSQLFIRLESAGDKLNELEVQLGMHKGKLLDLEMNGLGNERVKFLKKWNDPATNMTAAIATTVHYPDEDPMAEFLSSVSGHGNESTNPVDTYFFAPTPDGFYNQNGLSLQEFMKTRPAKSALQTAQRDVICVFPVFDSTGNISTEMVKSVKNPERSTKDPTLPTIKFVETYRIEVGWLGYGLGELSHSFNLFPGESKELVVEKSTKLSTKLSQTSASETETATHLTSSFEDNLQNEFSVGEKAAQDSSSTTKKDASQSNSAEDTSSSESTSTSAANVQASVSGGMFGFSASVSAGASSGSSAKSSSSSKRNSALAASQSAEEKKGSNQSKDVLSKDVSNAVRKVASDTSQNNKLSFTAVSSREYEESTSNRETIKLQNPNVGKTVNYNFFQVQNQFGVMVKLVDVQIVIDSGVEMVKGTGINDVRVHTLEEFGKIFANSDGSPHAAGLAAIVARQVFKHYGDFLPGVTSGNGSVTVRNGVSVDKEMLQVLNFSGEGGGDLEERMNRIKAALSYMKGIPFIFREKKLSEETTVSVNCAAYHVEAQLGFRPATEAYLEDRRMIETEKQRALVEHVKAQTKAGVFFQELPGGVTTLTMDGKAPFPAQIKNEITE